MKLASLFLLLAGASAAEASACGGAFTFSASGLLSLTWLIIGSAYLYHAHCWC